MLLIFKNYELSPFGEMLYKLSLKGKETRMRSRFISVIEKQVELIQREREILIKDFSKKDEHGIPTMEKDKEGRDFVVMDDAISFNIEISKLMNEEFIVEVTAENKDMIKTIQDIVLNVDEEFAGSEAEKYNRFCEILESAHVE